MIATPDHKPLRIGFILPAVMAVDGKGNGIRAQAIYQMDALRKLGHDVVGMHPWEEYDSSSFDLVQFFLGGFSTYGLELRRKASLRMLVFAPIIDTNEPFWRYRIATRLGLSLPKLFTIPAVFRTQADASDLVVCRSTYERDRVVKGLGVEPSKCTIVLNGVSPPAPADGSRARDAFDIDGEFLLHVGAYTQQRKNVLRLAHAALQADKPLIIAGRSDPGPTLDALRELERKNPRKVRILGFMERQTLEDLYDACKVFCLPSEHEGTGLVALEAAARGAGIVITKNGGPPDYFSDLAQYVDPTDTTGIAEAIQRAWDDPKGPALQAHVAELTWERSARSLVDAYRNAAKP